MNLQYIVIHHSLSKDSIVADWEAIRKYHREINGWADIGYHNGIEQVGNSLVLQVGRPESQPGAHVKELHMNSQSLGICVVGNYDVAPPGMELMRILAEIANRKISEYSIHGRPIKEKFGHCS